jgi:hypothetical protein
MTCSTRNSILVETRGPSGSRNNSVSTATRVRAGRPVFDCRQRQGSEFFSRVQTGSEAYQASHSMGTWGNYPAGKAAGA